MTIDKVRDGWGFFASRFFLRVNMLAMDLAKSGLRVAQT
jgi:hypothetical protein